MATRLRAGLYTIVYTIDNKTWVEYSVVQNDERDDYPTANVGQWVVQYTIHSTEHSDDDGMFEVPFNTKKEALRELDAYMKNGSFSHLDVLGWCYTEN